MPAMLSPVTPCFRMRRHSAGTLGRRYASGCQTGRSRRIGSHLAEQEEGRCRAFPRDRDIRITTGNSASSTCRDLCLRACRRRPSSRCLSTGKRRRAPSLSTFKADGQQAGALKGQGSNQFRPANRPHPFNFENAAAPRRSSPRFPALDQGHDDGIGLLRQFETMV